MQETSLPPAQCLIVLTVFQIHRNTISDVDIQGMLRVNNADASFESRHIESMRVRRSGQLSLAKLSKENRGCCFPFSDICNLLNLPAYQRQISEREAFRWTLDWFNPCNADYMLPAQLTEHDYIALIVETETFRPFHYRISDKRNRNDIYSRYEILWNMIRACLKILDPLFIFGTAKFHLNVYSQKWHSDALRENKLHSPPTDFRQLLWEWAMYSPDHPLFESIRSGELQRKIPAPSPILAFMPFRGFSVEWLGADKPLLISLGISDLELNENAKATALFNPIS